MGRYLRCFIAFGLFQDQLPFGIHCEYPAHRHTHLLIGEHITRSVSKGGVEGMCVWEEQVLDVCQALDLELLRLLFYDLPVEGREEAAWGEHEGSLRQEGSSVVHPVQVSSSHVSHADRSGRTVQELVTIPAAVRESRVKSFTVFTTGNILVDLFLTL